MNNQTLRSELEKLDTIADEQLLQLAPRKLKELQFHDENRDRKVAHQLSKDAYKKLRGNEKFYSTVQLSSDYVDNWIRTHSKGKVFLDYACGNGSNAVKAAVAGADLALALDISSVSVQNARKLAREHGVAATTRFVQADCEHTGLPDECIDVCICSGMLHHLDLSYAFCELRRILKPGGVILAIEALDYNPLIKCYRLITPQMRTEWEKKHILSFRDIEFARRFFSVRAIMHWHLFSILGAYVPSAMPLLNEIDRLFLRIPLLRMMSWMLTFELHKRSET
jgi:ubiquinone/menaquinone biosynthesis C-methylase UbiE